MGKLPSRAESVEKSEASVLVSWVGKNDPFALERSCAACGAAPERTEGPTLTLLCDPASPYAGTIGAAHFFYQRKEEEGWRRLRACLRERVPGLAVGGTRWEGGDPTDHRAIFDFLGEQVRRVRAEHAGRELVVHISPGTPSMQTVWVLMAECGFIDRPFRAVKSYRPGERPLGRAAAEVAVGIETFYRTYQASRLRDSSEEESVRLDPERYRSRAGRALCEEARRYAPLAVPILLRGERGTGKTTLARWIRARSGFCNPSLDGRWSHVVCGQYSPETMRGELFGFKKGSFTGADRDHPGLLAELHGDTLFLDEVGDMSRDLQRLLIRAVEEKVYQRMGEVTSRRSDFRLLTATNLPEAELGARLDPDFYDRIAPVQLLLPPLRELREDLGWIWDDVLAAARRRARAPAAELSAAGREAIVSALCAHRLPGNLRDLFRVAYRLLGALSGEARLGPGEAVDYALGGLAGGAALAPGLAAGGAAAAFAAGAEGELHRAVCGCFARGEGLEGALAALPPQGRLPLKGLFPALRAYVGGELRRLGRLRGVRPEALCDLSERSLFDWDKRSGA